jgi:hypothetical protein
MRVHLERVESDREAMLRGAAAAERMVTLLADISTRLGRLEALAERGPTDPPSPLSPAKGT